MLYSKISSNKIRVKSHVKGGFFILHKDQKVLIPNIGACDRKQSVESRLKNPRKAQIIDAS